MTKTKEKIVKAPNLGKILKPYENQWVALSPDKRAVLSSGNSLKEVRQKVAPNKKDEASVEYRWFSAP